jgi:hypothetical protein
MASHLTSLAVIACLGAWAIISSAAIPVLVAGNARLEWAGDAQNGFRPRVVVDGTVAEAAGAAAIQFVVNDGPALRIELNYSAFRQAGPELIASGKAESATGTKIEIVDRWSIDPAGGFILNREVTCRAKGDETAYASEIELIVPQAKKLVDADVFIPGIWYATADHTPKSGLITDFGQRDFILREDRMPLPLVSVRDRASGWSLTMEHRKPDGATIGADDNIGRVMDERLLFGSLGVRRDDDQLRIVFCFPGSEGEQTGIFGYKPDLRTAERFHPLKVGATQRYTLAVRVEKFDSFNAQVRGVWRAAYQAATPEVVKGDIRAVFDASINVLDHYAYTKASVSGFPFGVSLPDGAVKDPSLQMGFVGQQLPCASYLIDEGIRSNRPELTAKGERVVDFWVKNSFNEKGVPRTWYDLEPTPHWRNYNTFLRVVTDGTSGALHAWQIERAAGRTKPTWSTFARRVGEWLLKIQNKDGSFYREWRFDGSPASQSKTSTLHPVRLLVDLSCATGEKKYRDAAIRAAEFALTENKNGATYVGGTPDNPDVIDKEAGWIAMDSYLALYDVTQDKKWLDAALDAATFTETWVYAWNVPLPRDKENVGVPRVKTFAGTNLIATGHSGADNFLAFASFSYVRLWIYTGDEHWLDVAKLLQHNSAQFIETGKDGNALGYAVPGLQVEAFSLAVNRGNSVKIWLPWLTSATLEPMARMRETFGEIDVDSVAKIDRADLKRRNSEAARDRGYRSPAAK